MYEEAVQLERKGKDEAALRRYLQCLEDLEANNNFKSLPQCLHKVNHLSSLVHNTTMVQDCDMSCVLY